MFSPDYAAARRRFLSAAEARGADLASFAISARGPSGEELATDAAYLGPDQPRRLLVISSGIHGVEGYAGSAIQVQWLEQQLDQLALPLETGVLLIHAINPYGFAHTRRVNENNVDLNRNFLKHPDEHVDTPDYDRLFEAINPIDLEDGESAGRAALLAYAQEFGFPRLQHVLTCGQYRHPRGMQFGGFQSEASNVHVRAILRRHRGAEVVAWLDIHTGLGASGEWELVSQHEIDSPAYLTGRRWFGDKVRTTLTGESASARLYGDMLDGATSELEAGLVVPFAPEFGTYDGVRIFNAMRADNWLRNHGEVDSEQGQRIQAELREVFCPADPQWRATVLQQGAEVIRRTVAGLASE